MDAFLIRTTSGRRLAAAWSAVEAYDKMQALGTRAARVDRVEVSGRCRPLPPSRPPAPPAGYHIRPFKRPLAAATLKRRWPREWKWRVLRPILESGEEWYALRGGHDLSPLTNALNARGLLDIAVPDGRRSSKPFLYRVTERGRRYYSDLRHWQ